MKKLLLVVGLILSLAVAADVSVTSTTATNTVVLTSAKVLDSITVTSGSNVVVRLYDTKYIGLVWTNTAYTNYLTYVTNLVTTFTNADTGLTNSFTNKVLYTSVSAVAASTNNPVVPFDTFAIAANQAVTFPLNFVLISGLCVSNNASATYILNYH